MNKWLVVGVVFEDYGTDRWPGVKQGTVGYRTLDRTIFDAERSLTGKKTKGRVMSILFYLFIYLFIYFFEEGDMYALLSFSVLSSN